MLGCCCKPCIKPCDRLIDIAGSFTFDPAGSGASAALSNYVDDDNFRHCKVTVTLPNSLPASLNVFYVFLKLTKAPPENWSVASMRFANSVKVNGESVAGYDFRGSFQYFNNLDNKWYIHSSQLDDSGETGGSSFPNQVREAWRSFDTLGAALTGLGFTFAFPGVANIPLFDSSDTDVYLLLMFRVPADTPPSDYAGAEIEADLWQICDTYLGSAPFGDECNWKWDIAYQDIFHRFQYIYSAQNGDHNNPNYSMIRTSRSFGTPGTPNVTLCRETLDLLPYATYTDVDEEETYQIFRSEAYTSLSGETCYLWGKLKLCTYYVYSVPRYWISTLADDYTEPDCIGTVPPEIKPIWDNILNADSPTHDPYNLVSPIYKIVENFAYISSTSNTRFRGSKYFPERWFSTPRYLQIRNCNFFPSGTLTLTYDGVTPPTLFSSCATSIGVNKWLLTELDMSNISCQPYEWGTVDAGTLYPRYTNRFTATNDPQEIGDSNFNCAGVGAGTGLASAHIGLFLTSVSTENAYIQTTPQSSPVLNCGPPTATNCNDSSFSAPCDINYPRLYFDLCWIMSSSSFTSFAIRMLLPNSTFVGQASVSLGSYDIGNTLTEDWQTQVTKYIGDFSFPASLGTGFINYIFEDVEFGSFEYRIVRETVY